MHGSMTIAEPPAAPLACDAGAQLALGDVLQVLVDRQLERRARRRRPLDAAERLPPRVGLDEHRAGAAADERVVGRLDAAQADVVDADVAEHVRRQILVRDRSAGSP